MHHSNLHSNLEAIFNVNAQILKDWDSRDPSADEALVIGRVY